jgi:hypothetical protein
LRKNPKVNCSRSALPYHPHDRGFMLVHNRSVANKIHCPGDDQR